MSFRLSFRPLDDGISSEVRVSGGGPGPHRVEVRDAITGFGLGRGTFHHDAHCVITVPVAHKYVVLSTDNEEEYRLEVTHKPWVPADEDTDDEAVLAVRKAARKASTKHDDPGSAAVAVEPSTVAPKPNPEKEANVPDNDHSPAEDDTPTNAADPRNSSLPAPGADLPVPDVEGEPDPDEHADSVDPEPTVSEGGDQHQHEPRPSEKKKEG